MWSQQVLLISIVTFNFLPCNAECSIPKNNLIYISVRGQYLGQARSPLSDVVISEDRHRRPEPMNLLLAYLQTLTFHIHIALIEENYP